MNRQVKDLIRQRGLQWFASVDLRSSVLDALNVLEATNSDALLVLWNGGLRGIFSERDFARAAVNNGIELTTGVASVMTTKIYYAEPHFTLEECLQIMSRAYVRQLPVMEGNRPISLISMRHIVEILLEDRDEQIRELKTYITGTSQVLDFSQRKDALTRLPVFTSGNHQEAL